MKHTAPNITNAFTLVELVISVGIMGILATGLASAVLIATHALPSEQDTAQIVLDSAPIVDQLAEELRSALWIMEHSTTAITFTVADRNSDGIPERIRYAWSGAAGDPLTRQYNSGSAVEICPEVNEFALAYDLKTIEEEYSGPPVEGAEQVLSSFDNFDDEKEKTIEKEKWSGQYFKPALPENALCWRVTRVSFMAKEENNDNDLTYVRLRVADANKLPTDTVLGEVEMYESELPDYYTWKEIVFDNMIGLCPDQDLCLVWEHSGVGGKSAKIRYEDDWGSGRLWTDNSGIVWGYIGNKAFYHYIYGKVGTPGSPQTATRQCITRVNIALQTRDDAEAGTYSAAQTLNKPELLTNWWETRFDSDPRYDANGDGYDDWTERVNGLDPGTFESGVWHPANAMRTYPDCDFTTLTTIKVRFRGTTAGGQGALLMVNADWSGLICAPFTAQVQLQPDNTQTLKVSRELSDGTMLILATVTGLPSNIITLRLLIDPDLNTINIQANGEDRGTYFYTNCLPTESTRGAMIYGGADDAEFDYISVRVSEAD
ncbi:MAG: type II secretion system protein [Planctomycetota bacterium]